ncbi:MAG: CHRD domain-containing protein [Candidatus Limnocylindria bacterium]
MRSVGIAILVGAVLGMVNVPPAAGAGSPLTLSARLSAAAEVPPVAGGASGRDVVTINAERTELHYRITYRGLSGPLVIAAFCIGWSSSDVTCAFIGAQLPIGPSPLVGTRAIVGIQADDWTSGQAWVQLITAKHPQGEIRGRLVTLPATSTASEVGGIPLRWPFLPAVLAGAVVAWLFLRRLEERAHRRAD